MATPAAEPPDGDSTADSPAAGDTSYESTIVVLDRAQRGDTSAARILLERAVPGLRRWARGRLPRHSRDAADTEDIVNDVVLQVLKRLRRFEHRTVGGLQAYLRESVLNRIRDAVRRVRRRGVPEELPPELPVEALSPAEIAILRERLDLFLEALQRLKPAERQLVVWRVELGYSDKEIAERLGKRADAASMSVRRAIAKLVKEIGTRQ